MRAVWDATREPSSSPLPLPLFISLSLPLPRLHNGPLLRCLCASPAPQTDEVPGVKRARVCHFVSHKRARMGICGGSLLSSSSFSPLLSVLSMWDIFPEHSALILSRQLILVIPQHMQTHTCTHTHRNTFTHLNKHLHTQGHIHTDAHTLASVWSQ